LETQPFKSTSTHVPSIHHERNLLLVAFAFLLVGAVTLAVADERFAGSDLRVVLPHLALALAAWSLSFGGAHYALNRYLPHRDPLLLPTTGLMTGWSLLLIGRLASNFLLRQAVWVLVSVVACLLVVRLSENLRWLRRFRYTWLLGGLLLLAATLLFGVNPSGYGLRLWLGGWGLYLQPSEPLKLLMIVYLASYLAERGEMLTSERLRLGQWTLPPLAYVGPLLVMFGLTIVLLAWQQDLGAGMLFFFTFLAMLYLATGQWQYVAAGLAFFALAGLAGYLLSDRVALRVDGWIDPWPNAADRAFQIVQSLLALGSGGIFGRGLGLGDPTYIPAVHTDFIFAALAEEFGLAGVLALLALYGVLLLRGFRIAIQARRPFERLLAAGLVIGLIVQAWVIMAGNARLAPITGVTAPFLSYGGSSLLTSFIALALLLRISGHNGRLVNRYTGTPVYQSTNLPVYQSTNLAIYHVVAVLSLALALLAVQCGYWSIARADKLKGREDNPRRVLYEQRIVRGRILDRDGALLADVNVSDNGVVRRIYPVPETAPAVGYASLRYGVGGIEAAFDAQLRGETDRDVWQAAWAELRHQPPHGRDLQLTLDAALQTEAQRALSDHSGAAVLIDAVTGDILVLASAPTFDPNRLGELWESLREDPSAPLVNRATQGLYQPGAALQTVILAEALLQDRATLSTLTPDAEAQLPINGMLFGCSGPISQPHTLARAYAAACPAPFADLGERLGTAGLHDGIARWSLTTAPSLTIPSTAIETDMWLSQTLSLQDEAIGQGKLTVSPLHMALVAGTLANQGNMPTPHLVLRIQDAERQWQTFPRASTVTPIIPAEVAKTILATWPAYGPDVVGHTGAAISGRKLGSLAWFLGVTPGAASGDEPRYAVAVLLEQTADPRSAAEIGAMLLEQVTQ